MEEYRKWWGRRNSVGWVWEDGRSSGGCGRWVGGFDHGGMGGRELGRRALGCSGGKGWLDGCGLWEVFLALFCFPLAWERAKRGVIRDGKEKKTKEEKKRTETNRKG